VEFLVWQLSNQLDIAVTPEDGTCIATPSSPTSVFSNLANFLVFDTTANTGTTCDPTSLEQQLRVSKVRTKKTKGKNVYQVRIAGCGKGSMDT
jgi:hypothetical protein